MTDAMDTVPRASEAAGEILELNRQYIDAARSNDIAWFDRHMSDKALIILGNGRRMRKRQYLDSMRLEPKRFKSLTVQDATTRVFGAMVQVDADAPWELESGATGISRYIDTYVWAEGRWQVVSAQVTWVQSSP